VPILTKLRDTRARVWNRLCEHAARRSKRLLYKPHLYWLNEREWLAPYARAGIEERIIDRRFTYVQHAKLARSLHGHTAECGVFTGVTSFIFCQALAGTYGPDEHHWAIDSFQGVSRPVQADGTGWQAGVLTSPIEVARARLAPFPVVRMLPGWIPDVLRELPDVRYRLVHIDVDLYEPTRDALAYFYPRMVPGGVLLFDDYGFQSCPGARLATDEFFSDKPEPIVELATGQAVVLRSGT
jgi:O-methyltransferase